jgi:putative pyruvate formate lyase activating enzyme
MTGLDPNAFVLDDFEPAYLALDRRGELDRRVEAAREALRTCRSCPRDCGVNRLADERDFCKTGRNPIVSSAFAHHGEEDCLRGTNGSGTIFFSSCNLRCVFCQNADISHGAGGEEMAPDEIARTMIRLQETGCHNINFVSPSHVVPQVVEAICHAVPLGLRVPVVYNTSAYDAPRSLALLEGLIDIYMPDFKFWTAASSQRYNKAKDYPDRARAALREMHRQVGPLVFDRDDVALRGLLVRHLVMPGMTEESREIFRFLAGEISADTYVNIMGQYHPANLVSDVRCDGSLRYGELARRPSRDETLAAYDAALAAGLWRFDERRSRILFLRGD